MVDTLPDVPPLHDSRFYFTCGMCDAPLEVISSGCGNGFFVLLGCPRCKAPKVCVGEHGEAAHG